MKTGGNGMSDADGFKSWAVLELMGHRKYAGLIEEVEIAGSAFFRIDVYEGDAEEPASTQFYSPNAVYCMTPCDESIARQFGELNKPRPVTHYELPAPAVESLDEPNF